MKFRPLFLFIGCMAAMLLPGSVPAAQIFEDITLPSIAVEMDPSMRSTAMGGASGAVFWGSDPNYWANPALLGYTEGLRYDDALVDMGTLTVTDETGFVLLSFDIQGTARRIAIGHGGIGIALAGQPFDTPEGTRWEFGTLIDQVRSWSVGISLAGVAESVLHERTPALARHFDLAFGYTHKTLEEDAFSGDASLWDWGLLARGGTDFAIGRMASRIEGAYGFSYLNRNDEPSPNNRRELHCVGLHLSAARLPEGFAGIPSWLRAGFEPLVSIGGEWDADYVPWSFDSHSEGLGGELGLANILFLRLGRTRGELSTRGYGIGLPIGRFGGVRYDDASVDSALDFDYRAWSVWIDPLAIARAGR
jgi:hypothetical protein